MVVCFSPWWIVGNCPPWALAPIWDVGPAPQTKSFVSSIQASYQYIMWPIHGNLDDTLMLVFCRRSATKLRHNYNITLTKHRQNLVDEDPDLAKTPWGPLRGPQYVFGIVLGSHQPSLKLCQSYVIVLPKFCRRPPTKNKH